MFFSSASSFLSDIILFNKATKYKILRIQDYNKNKISVVCELVSEAKEIIISLDDIIQNNKLKYFSTKDIIKLSGLFSEKNNDTLFSVPCYSRYFIILTQLFIVTLLASNIAATKLTHCMGVTFSGGMITFPLLYILNDVATEVYGFKASRRIIYTAFTFNLLLFSLLYAIVFLPSYGNNGDYAAFDLVFSLSPKVFLASSISYLISEFLNSFILANLKVKLKGRYFGFRALISTFCAALIDTSIFFCIVFIDVVNMDALIPNIITLAFVKVAYELMLLPITLYLVTFLKKREHLNVFEVPTLSSLNPFS